MLDRLVSPGMELDPSIDLKDAVVEYDDMSAVCNQTLDEPPRQEGVFPGAGPRDQVRGHDAW